MKREIPKLAAAVLISMTQFASAVPSGFGTIPNDVVIPSIGGQTIPVTLLPSLEEGNTVYVKPNLGKLVGASGVKSPITKCENVEGELKMSEYHLRFRDEYARNILQKQLDAQKNQEKLASITKKYEELNALVTAKGEEVAGLEAARDAILLEIQGLKAEIKTARGDLSVEEDKDKIKSLNDTIARIEKEVKEKKLKFVEAGRKSGEATEELVEMKMAFASVKGKKEGLDKTMTSSMQEIDQLRKRIDELAADSRKVLQTYSKDHGGTVTFTYDFAPSEYIAALKQANPKYQFRYVTAKTANVDATMPGNLRQDSPIVRDDLPLIKNANWTDAGRARGKTIFGRRWADAVKAENGSEKHASEFEDSLEGTKFLSLDLSVLGYCALNDPKSLKTQFDGAADTFKLQMYYTYPVNYQVRVTGHYFATQSLYELYKESSSSSWFGLSKSQKREHVRKLAAQSRIEVNVVPLGVEMSFAESQALTHKVKEQLHFLSIEKYLDLGKVPPLTAQGTGELGATKVGKSLMMIPNPYAFWGGVILMGLGEMFGSSSSESVREMINTSRVDVNETNGFTFLYGASLSVGDLSKVPFKVGN